MTVLAFVLHSRVSGAEGPAGWAEAPQEGTAPR
jgi:hypothetical protein